MMPPELKTKKAYLQRVEDLTEHGLRYYVEDSPTITARLKSLSAPARISLADALLRSVITTIGPL
jgi:hypothetical protein